MTNEQSLELFVRLTKDGCEWHGDVISRKWSECLYFSEDIEQRVKRTLDSYEEGKDYKLENGCVWIA